MHYGGPAVLDGVTLQIERGERIALVGRNGEGKSTLLRILAGEEKPDGGGVTIQNGVRVGALPQHVPRELPGTVLAAVVAAEEADQDIAIRRLRRDRPDARIVVTGCAAQVNAGAFAAMPEVDHVIGNREKLNDTLWRDLGTASSRVTVGDILTDAPAAPPFPPATPNNSPSADTDPPEPAPASAPSAPALAPPCPPA